MQLSWCCFFNEVTQKIHICCTKMPRRCLWMLWRSLNKCSSNESCHTARTFVVNEFIVIPWAMCLCFYMEVPPKSAPLRWLLLHIELTFWFRMFSGTVLLLAVLCWAPRSLSLVCKMDVMRLPRGLGFYSVAACSCRPGNWSDLFQPRLLHRSGAVVVVNSTNKLIWMAGPTALICLCLSG